MKIRFPKVLATALVVFPENKVIFWRHGTGSRRKTGETSAVLSHRSEPAEHWWSEHRGFHNFVKAQAVLQGEPTPVEGDRDQVCDLCKVEPGARVTITKEWKSALWVAEKQVVTRISTPGAITDFDQVCLCSIWPSAETVGLVL